MKKPKQMKIFNSLKLTPKNTSWALALMLLLTTGSSFAQADGSGNTGMLVVVGIVAILAVLVLLVAIYTLQVLKKIEEKQKADGITSTEEESLWKAFLKVVNDRADEDQEADIMLTHNYDGIKELDNHLPPWWKWLFYITIIWSVIYVIGHHYTGWFPLQEVEYTTEIDEANALKIAQQGADVEGGGFDESALVYDADASQIETGSKIYVRNCIPCHGSAGEGNTIGPNLTDKYWLYGGGIKDIFTTIKNGVPDKGMISWESQLSPTQIRDVSSYILSLQGTNPANAKAPQGQLDGEEEEGSADAEAEEVPEEEQVADAGSSEGKEIFDTTCAACHTADGGGVTGLGPNLTDKYWKNSDGSRDGIIGTIKNGVAGTSMVAWSSSLDAAQIEAVTDYVLAFQGTTPANPKEPEGDLYE